MTSETYVRISIERQKLILGQIGNMRAKITQLGDALLANDQLDLAPYVLEIAIELEFFEKYFPSIPDDFPF